MIEGILGEFSWKTPLESSWRSIFEDILKQVQNLGYLLNTPWRGDIIGYHDALKQSCGDFGDIFLGDMNHYGDTFNDRDNRVHAILKRIHFDVCVPFSKASTTKHMYYVIFVDDSSHKC